MANRTMNDRLQALEARGFDASEPFGGRWNMQSIAVRCSACDARVINGTACHETGCPHAVHECNGCNELIPVRQKYCEECA